MNFRNISAWSIRNPVIPMVLFIALLIAGLVSFSRMDVTNNPDIEFPGVSVGISQPGAAPTEIENQITQVVESALSSINGVKTVNSTAREGFSSTFVEFEIGTDPDNAVIEVKNAVDTIRGNLPDGILEPRISKEEIAGGFLGIYAVQADDMTIEQLSWFIDDTVAKRLNNISGMAEVGRWGGVDREIEVILDPAKMQALGVTASQINSVLRQANIDAAGGLAEVGGTRQSLRVLGNNDTAYELSQRQIQLGGGRTVRLADIATVRDGFSERTSISEVGDREVVNFYMSRARGASDVAVFDEAQAEIARIEAENEGVRFISLFNTVVYTEEQYTSSMAALIEGALLAVVVVFLFLRDWRATFISSVAIPLSAIPTFFFMDLMGFNLNFLSLLALALVAGVLVDDAIVEIENIVRHMRMGKTAYQASIDAADEIGLPVVATSFCIVAVFLPVGLMPGISGQFFQNFGLTVVVAVLMSLAVARMITPLMAAYFLKADGHAQHGEGPWMDRYMKVLAWTLDRGNMYKLREGLTSPRSRILYSFCLLLAVLLLLVATAFGMFGSFGLFGGFELANTIALAASQDINSWTHFFVSKLFEIVLVVLVSILAFVVGWLVFKIIELPANGASRFSKATRYMTARFYDHRIWMLGVGWFSLLVTILLFSQIPSQFQPSVDDANSTVAIEMVPGTTLASTEEVVEQVVDILEEQPEIELMLERVRIGNANIYITLKEDRERSSIEFEREVGPLLQDIPDARVRFESQMGGFGSGRDLTIMLAGSDPAVLEETAATLVEQMRGIDTLVAPRVSADLNRPEIIITPREEIAAELGVSTIALSQTIRIATLGEIEQNAAKFSLSDRQIPIRVKLSPDARSQLSTIENLPVQTINGGTVPLGRVADISFGSGPTAIQRYNQNRRVLVGADLASGVIKGEAQAEVDRLPILRNLPTGVIRDVVGEDEWQQEMQQNLFIAVIAGVFLVFACLVLLYKRLMSPLVNMTSLALAPLGGIMLLWLVGMAQTMPVYIGILLLLGIVSKNSILLIDFAIEEMAKGTRKLHAIMEAGHKRAQPIVMTTVAMTAGMVPTSISLSGDGAWRQPMGIVVIGGLIMSTVLTLIIVPAGFSLADGFERRVGPWLRRTLLTYKPGDDGNPVLPDPHAGPDTPYPAGGGRNGLTGPGAEPAE